MSSSDGFDTDDSMAMDDENPSEDEDDFDDEVSSLLFSPPQRS